MQSFSASRSPAIGEGLAQMLGYHNALFILGSFALGSVALWLGFAGMLRPACAAISGPMREGAHQ